MEDAVPGVGAPSGTHEVRVVCTGEIHSLEGWSGHRVLSIILPVKNAASQLRTLIPRILGQRCDAAVEIVAIDSGSVDDTVGVLRGFRATVLAIKPDDFNYGATRNLAAKYARGEILVFLTARVLPADDLWLENLIAPLAADSDIAGVYSRFLPRSDADLLNRRGSLHGTTTLTGIPGTRSIENLEAYRALSPDERHWLFMFCNMSAAIRPEIFARIPFREATMGEDMIWAKDVLEAGYKIRYETSSVVFHSHNYSPTELLRRAFDAGIAMREILDKVASAVDIVPAIISSVRNDWHYLEHGCRLERDDLESWQVRSIMHHSAWMVGYWLGVNSDRLPGNLESLVTYLEQCEVEENDPYLTALVQGRRDVQGGTASPLQEEEIVSATARAIVSAWHGLPIQGPADQLIAQRLECALMASASIAGRWSRLHANQAWRDLVSEFSLVGQIKSSLVTHEMEVRLEPPSVARTSPNMPSEATDSEARVWRGDARGVVATVDAYEAEISHYRQLVSEIQAASEKEVSYHKQIIRDVQRDAEKEIDHHKAVIREIQNAMELEINHRDEVIRNLQQSQPDHEPSIEGSQSLKEQLDAIHRTRAWRLIRRYWRLRDTLVAVARRGRPKDRTATFGLDPRPVTAEEIPLKRQASLDVIASPVSTDSDLASMRWDTGDDTVGQVWVSTAGEPERLVSEGTSGSKSLPWIEPGAEYEFFLYAGTSHEMQLARATVMRPITVASILKSVQHGNGAIILLYHRVGDSLSDPWSLCVTPGHFREHMQILRENFRPISLHELVESLGSGDLPERSVVVTFDDGYRDLLHNAKPILEECGIPATAFIPSGFLGIDGGFWWHELERLLLRPGTLPDTLQLVIEEELYEWSLGDTVEYSEDRARSFLSWRARDEAPTPRHQIYRALSERLRSLDPIARQNVLEQLETWANGTASHLREPAYLSRQELRLLAEGGLIEIGAHTVNHPALVDLDLLSQREEIEQGKSQLEGVLHRPVTSFAYPFGRACDYSAETVALVREAGYRCACSNIGGTVGHTSDILQLPRAYVSDCDSLRFAHRLVAWFAKTEAETVEA